MAKKVAESQEELLVKGDEKLLGAVCHFSIFFLPIVLPLIVWLIEKDKKDFSPFVVFQAKQALLYQLTVFVLFIGIGLFGLGLSYLLFGLLFLPAYLIVYLMALIYAAYGGIQCLLGVDFQYFYLGEKIHEWRI